MRFRVILSIVTILVIVLIFLYNNIKQNVTGEIVSYDINTKNKEVIANTLIDVNIKFDVVNNSLFKFMAKNFYVTIKNLDSGKIITKSKKQDKVIIDYGSNLISLDLNDIKAIGVAESMIKGKNDYRIEIYLKVFGLVNVMIEKDVEFSL